MTAMEEDRESSEHDEIAALWPWHGDLGGKTLKQAIEDEMADYQMVMRHCSDVYDAASFGHVSKPQTLPSVVLQFMNEKMDEYIKADALTYREELREGVRLGMTALKERLATAKRERDEAVKALEQIGCHYAIPCVDHRAIYDPNHVFCTRCEALGRLRKT